MLTIRSPAKNKIQTEKTQPEMTPASDINISIQPLFHFSHKVATIATIPPIETTPKNQGLHFG